MSGIFASALTRAAPLPALRLLTPPPASRCAGPSDDDDGSYDEGDDSQDSFLEEHVRYSKRASHAHVRHQEAMLRLYEQEGQAIVPSASPSPARMHAPRRPGAGCSPSSSGGGDALQRRPLARPSLDGAERRGRHPGQGHTQRRRSGSGATAQQQRRSKQARRSGSDAGAAAGMQLVDDAAGDDGASEDEEEEGEEGDVAGFVLGDGELCSDDLRAETSEEEASPAARAAGRQHWMHSELRILQAFPGDDEE